MQGYIIINGFEAHYREFKNETLAFDWAVENLDRDKEIIIHYVKTLHILAKTKEVKQIITK